MVVRSHKPESLKFTGENRDECSTTEEESFPLNSREISTPFMELGVQTDSSFNVSESSLITESSLNGKVDKSPDMDSRTIVLTHLAQTSAHGIPRAVTSKSMLIRFCWTIFFIAAVCAFTFHLKNLFIQYVGQPINLVSDHRAVQFDFPNLYICNPMTFSSSINIRNKERKDDKHDRAENERNETMLKGELVRELLMMDLETLRESRWIKDESSVMITSLFSSTNISQLRLTNLHTKEQTLIKATLNDKDIGLESFIEVPHREYLNCIQFINTSQLRTPEDELTLYLFTDAFVQSVDDLSIKAIKYKGSVEYDMSSGLVLLFAEQGSYPGTKAIRLLPSAGMKTDIVVSMSERRMINTRKRPCRAERSTLDNVNHLSTNTDKTITYNLDYYECVENDWSLAFYSSCGCIPLNSPVPIHLENAVRCLNVSSWSIKETAENIRCIFLVSRNLTLKQSIEKSCCGYEPCTEREYSVQWSNSVWPAITLIPSVVQKIVMPTYEDRINRNYSVPGWKSMIKALNSSQLSDIVRDNMLKVVVRPAHEMSTVWTESEAYPVTYLISDIGGILGLYLGISVLTLCEVLDLCFAFGSHLYLTISKRRVD